MSEASQKARLVQRWPPSSWEMLIRLEPLHWFRFNIWGNLVVLLMHFTALHGRELWSESMVVLRSIASSSYD